MFNQTTSLPNTSLLRNRRFKQSYYMEGDPDYVKEKDEQAIQIFQAVFPTREVQTLNPLELNYDGGGLHCITLPKPKHLALIQK